MLKLALLNILIPNSTIMLVLHYFLSMLYKMHFIFQSDRVIIFLLELTHILTLQVLGGRK